MTNPIKTKTCSRCRRRRRVSSFNKKKSSKDGFAYYCRDCQKAYHASWSKTAPAVRSRRKRQTVNRKRLQEEVKRHKSVPCADCGVTYPHYVMDFDHVRGEKLFSIGTSQKDFGCKALSVLRQEIAKCEVVCSNCHRERTWQAHWKHQRR